MIDNEKAMKLLQVADKVDFESDEMVIEGKLDVNGKITANNGVEVAEGTILTVPSASNVFIKDESTNLDQELYAKQDKLVSGTNIKTINGNSVLGSGNITIEGGGTTYTARDPLFILESENTIGVSLSSNWFDVRGGSLTPSEMSIKQYALRLELSSTIWEIAPINTRMMMNVEETITAAVSEMTGATYDTFDAACAALSQYWSNIPTAYRLGFIQKMLNLMSSCYGNITILSGYGTTAASKYQCSRQPAVYTDYDTASVKIFSASGTLEEVNTQFTDSNSLVVTMEETIGW